MEKLGNIIGKTSTSTFKAIITGNAHKLQYIQVPYQSNFALAQIIELEKNEVKQVLNPIFIKYV